MRSVPPFVGLPALPPVPPPPPPPPPQADRTRARPNPSTEARPSFLRSMFPPFRGRRPSAAMIRVGYAPGAIPPTAGAGLAWIMHLPSCPALDGRWLGRAELQAAGRLGAAGVEGAPQAVAEQVEGERGEQQRHAGED